MVAARVALPRLVRLESRVMNTLITGGGAFIIGYSFFVTRPRLGHFQQYIIQRRAMIREFNDMFPPLIDDSAHVAQPKRDPRFVTSPQHASLDTARDHKLLLIDKQVREMARTDTDGDPRGQGSAVQLRVDDYYLWTMGIVTFNSTSSTERKEVRYLGVCMFWFDW